MLEIIPSPDAVVAMRAEGKIKRADVERAIAAIEKGLARHDHVALYAEIGPVAGMTGEAMTADLRYGMRQLGHLDRFGPTAVVTDEAWIANLSRLEGWLLPAMGLRVFPRDRAAEAMAYATSGERPGRRFGDEARQPRRPGIRAIPTDRHDAFAFEVDGSVTPSAMADIVEELSDAFDAHPKGIDLLVRVRSLPAIDLAGLGSQKLWRMKMRALTRVRRYALVGGPDWMAATATFAGRFTEVDIRHFGSDEEDRAWAWLDARPLENESRGGPREAAAGDGSGGDAGSSPDRPGSRASDPSPWAGRGAA